MEEHIFDNLNEEFHLSCDSKWDILRKLTKKINLATELRFIDSLDDEPTEDSKQKADPGVQLLPRQDVMLFGMLPKMEQRVYSKCRECRLIFNPRDILKHKDCTAKLYQETLHPSLLKKQQKQLAKAKANSNKKPVSGTPSTPLPHLPLFKKPRTPPPIKPKSSISRPPAVPYPLSTSNPLLELKVSVPRIPKITTTSSTNSGTVTITTSSLEKHQEDRVSNSSSVLSSNTPKSSSGHHSSRSPLKSSSHSSSHSSSSHRSSSKSSSSDSHKSSSSRSGTPDSHSSRSPSKSSESHSSSKSLSKSTPMEILQHLPSSKSMKCTTASESLHSTTHSSRSISKPTPMDSHPHSKSSSHSELHSSSRKSSPSSSTTVAVDTLSPPSKNTTPSSSHHHSSRHSTEPRSSSSSSSKHKKSKKSNSSSCTSPSSSSSCKGTMFDPDVHCGVVEGTKGPCTRSFTCSNHRIQLRKLVPGRSKDIHQLIAERKAAKERDAKPTPCSYTAPNAEAKDSAGQNTSYVFIVTKIVSTAGSSESLGTVTTSYVPIMPKVPVGIHTRPLTSSKMAEAVEKEADSPRTIVNGYVNQTTFETSPQDVYMPMSPISVANPVQFVKIGNKMMCLETPQSAKTPQITKNNPIFIQMPMNQLTPNIKSHPKPAKVLTYGTRKMGGAILFSNRRLESQRDAVLTALRPHCNKTVNKRSASDKLVTTDSKKMVSEVNGFFLHVDMSEASDSPQSDNLIQDKILLSMK